MNEGATLLDLSNEPATLTVNGATYTIKRLTLGDTEAAAQSLRKGRMKDYLDLLNVTPLSDELVADGLARIANAKITRFDLFSDAQGEVAMIRRAVMLDGKAVTDVPSLDRRLITHMLLWMTHTPSAEGADTGPFPDGSTVTLSTPIVTSENPGVKT